MENEFMTLEEFWDRLIAEGHCTERQVRWWCLRAKLLCWFTKPFLVIRYALRGLFCRHEFEVYDTEDGCETPWLCQCVKCGKMYRGNLKVFEKIDY